MSEFLKSAREAKDFVTERYALASCSHVSFHNVTGWRILNIKFGVPLGPTMSTKARAWKAAAKRIQDKETLGNEP